MKFSTARIIVFGVVFVSVIVGLVAHTATGTPSALGWRDISLLCPLGALEGLLGSRSIIAHLVLLLLVALAVGAVFGKSFCAWICPTPRVRQLFGADRRKRVVVRESGKAGAQELPDASSCGLAPVGGKRDGMHLDSRHAVLGGTLLSSLAFGFPVFCLACPVGLSFGITIGVFNLFRFNETSWGLVIFPIVLVLEVVVFRKWCTHLCPISALLSLVSSKTRLTTPKVDSASCLRSKGVDCKECVSVCPEQVDPHTNEIPECSRCGSCIDKCPAHAISLKLGRL